MERPQLGAYRSHLRRLLLILLVHLDCVTPMSSMCTLIRCHCFAAGSGGQSSESGMHAGSLAPTVGQHKPSVGTSMPTQFLPVRPSPGMHSANANGAQQQSNALESQYHQKPAFPSSSAPMNGPPVSQPSRPMPFPMVRQPMPGSTVSEKDTVGERRAQTLGGAPGPMHPPQRPQVPSRPAMPPGPNLTASRPQQANAPLETFSTGQFQAPGNMHDPQTPIVQGSSASPRKGPVPAPPVARTQFSSQLRPQLSHIQPPSVARPAGTGVRPPVIASPGSFPQAGNGGSNTVGKDTRPVSGAQAPAFGSSTTTSTPQAGQFASPAARLDQITQKIQQTSLSTGPSYRSELGAFQSTSGNVGVSSSQQHVGGYVQPPPPLGFGPAQRPATPTTSSNTLSRPAFGPAPPSFGGASSIRPSQQTPSQAPVPQTMPPTGGTTSSGGRNIDPGQMPHPSASMSPTQVFETRRENTHNIPPAVDVPIVVRDTGGAGPRHMRCSLNTVPQGGDMVKSAAIPFVVVINPLQLPEPNDTPIGVVDAGPTGPLRCQECKAYVCPFMKWCQGGRAMECCFCGALSEVPPEHFSGLTLENRRVDYDDRPELRCGSVEFIVGGPYQVRNPIPPTYLFMIEVTAGAIVSGATACACASIGQLVEELPGGDRTRVGIVTFDSRVHFYSFQNPRNTNANGSNPADSGNLDDAKGDHVSTPQMFVMSDVDDPFSVLGDRALVNATTHRGALKALLESIPKIFSGSQAGESAGGAALKASVETLKAGVGGRIVALVSSLPHRGALALRPREAGRPPTERDSLEVMHPEGKGYGQLASDAAEHQISVDVFALSQGYVDLATLTTLCSTSSGTAYRYNPFNPSADASRFHNDLRWCLIRPQGLEAVGRLRVSRGLSIDSYVGAFHRRNPTDLHFPSVSCDHSIAAKIVHEHRLQEGSDIYLQYALLYSALDGTRRVRVHTLALPVTRSLGTVFRGADLESYLSYIARKVSNQLAGRTLVACKDVIVKAIVDTLASYRNYCAASSSSAQLILPESLKLLPLYGLGLMKLPCFRTDARADSRAIWASRLLSLGADRIVSAVYPRLIPLHTLLTRQPSAPLIPDRLWVTAEKLDSDGIYLMENGFDAFLYVGSNVSSETCSALLGTTSIDAVDVKTWADVVDVGTPLSKSVVEVLGEIRRQRRSSMHLRLVRKGVQTEAAFYASLIEDRAPSTGMSYIEFLCHLHRQIQNKLN